MVLSYNDLPFVVKMLIFNELSFNTQKQCRLVCKEWRNILDNYPRYLKHKFTNAHLDNNNISLIFFTTNKIFTKLHVENLTNSLLLETLLLPISLEYYNHVESITFNNTNVIRKESNTDQVVPNLLPPPPKIVYNTSGDCMKMILQKFRNIRILKFCNSSFVNVKNPKFLRKIRFENVEELLIETVGIYNQNQHKSLMILTRKFYFGHKLKKFTWECTLAEYKGRKYFLLYENVYFFIASHQGLKELTINHPSATKLIHRRYCRSRIKLHNDIYAGIRTLNLTKLQLRTQRQYLPMLTSIYTWRFEILLTISQRKLCSFGLYGSHIFPYLIFQSYLLQLEPTLQEFHANIAVSTTRILSFHWKNKPTRGQLMQVLHFFYPPDVIDNIEVI